MTSFLASVHPYLTPLHTAIHPRIPFAPLDIYGAIRLSQVVEWVATGVLSPSAESDQPSAKSETKRVGKGKPQRAGVLQECMGLLVVLFGGETFLSTCTRTPPSWLITPKIGLLFCLIHILHTRTSLRRLIPARPTLTLELLLSIPDAIGRTLLLTRFSVLPLARQSPSFFALPSTPATLILVPFILAAPYAALAFTGTNLFSPEPSMSTPMELQPQGWLMVDAWLPLLIPAMFCTLLGPVPGWGVGLGWSEEEAITACTGMVLAAFLGRSLYNYGPRR